MTKKTREKNLFKTITFQVQAERDKDIWLWLRAMNYGQPSKTIRILLGVVAKAWTASAPDARETLESFVGKRMNAEMHENTEKHTEKHKNHALGTTIRHITKYAKTDPGHSASTSKKHCRSITGNGQGLRLMTKPTIIIAEKPSMGRAIADVITGVKFSKNGYIEIGNTIVTWCVGHLLENAQPEEYNPAWKSWAMKDLPFPITQWKVTPKPKTLTQLNIIGSLLKQAGSVVNAGDPDREGLMLVNEVLEYFHWTGPTERLILNSYDTPSVKKALANLTPNSVHDNLYEAAKCRSRADWLLGLSATRAATRAYTRFEDKTVISIGRVQTPALWLVVKRDLEIDNFNAKSFFTLAAHT
ncbi:DNA topoisomerase III, partial [mine drainage metagenome]